MIIQCSVCGNDMEIDSLNGVAYIKEQNGDIHHAYDCTPQEEGEGDAVTE